MADEAITTVGDFVPFQYGKGLTELNRNPAGKVPVYGSNGVVGFHDKPLTNGATIIIGRKGTVGAVHYSSEPCWPIDTTFYFSGTDPDLVRYRYFVLKSLGLDDMNSDSAVPGLNREAAHSLQIHIISEDEQRSIVHILGSLDDKIELNRRMNQTLENVARTIYKSWFIDYDPVRAKSNDESHRSICRRLGLTPDLLGLFPNRFQDSAISEIPEGWGIGNIDEEFEIIMGQSPPGETYNGSGEGLPFYQGSSDFGFRYPKRRIYCTSPTRFAKAGDTLVSVRAPVGDINMAAEDCGIGRGIAAIRHRFSGTAYTYYSILAQGHMFARFEAEGTVFGSITKKDFHNLLCIVPDEDIIMQFENIVGLLDNKIWGCECESDTLATLRDTLIPRLITGKIHVLPEGKA